MWKTRPQDGDQAQHEENFRLFRSKNDGSRVVVQHVEAMFILGSDLMALRQARTGSPKLGIPNDGVLGC